MYMVVDELKSQYVHVCMHIYLIFLHSTWTINIILIVQPHVHVYYSGTGQTWSTLSLNGSSDTLTEASSGWVATDRSGSG